MKEMFYERFQLPPIKWIHPTEKELRDEFHEADIQGLLVPAYVRQEVQEEAFELFKRNLEAEEIDPNELAKDNAWRFDFKDYDALKKQVTSYGGPKDPDSMVAKVRAGGALPMPVVVRRRDGSLLLAGGATRVAIAKLAGQKVRALVLDEKAVKLEQAAKLEREVRQDAKRQGVTLDQLQQIKDFVQGKIQLRSVSKEMFIPAMRMKRIADLRGMETISDDEIERVFLKEEAMISENIKSLPKTAIALDHILFDGTAYEKEDLEKAAEIEDGLLKAANGLGLSEKEFESYLNSDRVKDDLDTLGGRLIDTSASEDKLKFLPKVHVYKVAHDRFKAWMREFSREVIGEGVTKKPSFSYQKVSDNHDIEFEVVDNETSKKAGEIYGNIEYDPEWEGYEDSPAYEQLSEIPEVINLQHLGVEPEYRRQGIANKLMVMFLKEAKKIKAPIYINASTMGGLTQRGLVSFYKKFGFREVIRYTNYSNSLLMLGGPKFKGAPYMVERKTQPGEGVMQQESIKDMFYERYLAQDDPSVFMMDYIDQVRKLITEIEFEYKRTSFNRNRATAELAKMVEKILDMSKQTLELLNELLSGEKEPEDANQTLGLADATDATEAIGKFSFSQTLKFPKVGATIMFNWYNKVLKGIVDAVDPLRKLVHVTVGNLSYEINPSLIVSGA